MSLEEAPKGYEMFQKKQEECIKIVLKRCADGGNAQARAA